MTAPGDSGTPLAGAADSARPFDKRAADALAYACAVAIRRGLIPTRSEAIDDALLDYLNIGGFGGPMDVPTWMEGYERAQSPNDQGSGTPEDKR